jgi:hypothetical protein
VPSEEELRQMALDIRDVAALYLIDDICEVVMNED